jgi:phenylpropionate dioxygenase-like ring-hydroxylating dioxygenase large terminal subunit
MTDSQDSMASQGALAASAAPIATGRSLPPVCYTSSTIAADELALFRRCWLGVGRSDMVASERDYRTLDIAGQSIILTRNADGNLQAFANTCRHRGARLLDGSGNCRAIQCPFHSWTYSFDGSLIAAPHMHDAANFDRNDFGLVSYRVEERLGFVFVCLDPDAPDLDVVLGDFVDVHSPWPLETLVTTRRRELTVDCNWKSFLEVFNEYYHLPYVHPVSLGGLYAPPEPRDDTAGSFTTQFGLTQGTGALLRDEQDQALPPMPGLSGREANGVRYTWAFPTMTFAAGTDALWVYEAYPLGVDRCRVVQSACFPPETLAEDGADAKLAAYHERLDAALDEDIPALINQHRGLSNPDATQGRFQPLLEPSVAAFARWYSAELGHREPQQGVTDS